MSLENCAEKRINQELNCIKCAGPNRAIACCGGSIGYNHFPKQCFEEGNSTC